MTPAVAKRFRLLASALSVLLLIGALAAGGFYFRIRASLPRLDGATTVAGLGAPVTIERDAQGVPTLRGQTRADVSRALGWLHAQERFFQMDLLRRSSAGELAELFGKAALPLDRATRMHGFRKLAQRVLAQLPPAERTQLDAYTAGVNAGLAALGDKPFEYLVLRTTPQPWRPEDSILVVYAMTLDLQDEVGLHEQTLMTLRDKLGDEAVAFFAPALTPADAALDGTTAPVAPLPGPQLIDLRKRPKPLSSLDPRLPVNAPSAFPASDVASRFPSRPAIPRPCSVPTRLPSPARTPPAEPPSSRTIPTSTTAYPISGFAPHSSGPALQRPPALNPQLSTLHCIGSPASPCPESSPSSSAATATSRGASRSPMRTPATSSFSKLTPSHRDSTPRPATTNSSKSKNAAKPFSSKIPTP